MYTFFLAFAPPLFPTPAVRYVPGEMGMPSSPVVVAFGRRRRDHRSDRGNVVRQANREEGRTEKARYVPLVGDPERGREA